MRYHPSRHQPGDRSPEMSLLSAYLLGVITVPALAAVVAIIIVLIHVFSGAKDDETFEGSTSNGYYD